MIRPLARLARCRSGATAAEFAIVAPILIIAIFATFQFGTLFFANAGLQNAVGEGARLATLWPRRTQSQIAAEIQAAQFGLNPQNLATPQFTYGQAGGQDFVDITMTYTVDLDFLMFKVEDVTLQETRRAYRP
jgi:Flp pilus assembly protein TadG